MSTPNKLLVVGHDVKLDARAYKKLTDGGYIVLRGNPSDFHVMLPPLSLEAHDVISEAAFRALSQTQYDGTRNNFAKLILAAVLPDKNAKAEP